MLHTHTPEVARPIQPPRTILAAVTCCGDVLTCQNRLPDKLAADLIDQLPVFVALLATRHPVVVYRCELAAPGPRPSGYYHNGRLYVPVSLAAEFLPKLEYQITLKQLN